jgi:hypothetical protein
MMVEQDNDTLRLGTSEKRRDTLDRTEGKKSENSFLCMVTEREKKRGISLWSGHNTI